ncbi:MAG: hypothetical protein R3330_12420 [Saprospiraceae bacterium]|nr:hypothetical protein [Saprospiraceae bacterium]
MKYVILFATLLALSGAGSAQDSWQDKIDTAFGTSLTTGQDDLSAVYVKITSDATIPAQHYWEAYACYRRAIIALVNEDMDQGQQMVQRGIDVLKAREELTSEDHALLASLLGMLIVFDESRAMPLAMESGKHFQTALSKDDQNMRAYLGLGRGDFYTPVEYGGGQVVERHLQKALALPAAASDDPNAPSWGRDEAFMFLAMYYQREKRKAEGILTCKRGLNEFPEHSELKRILGELQKS